MCMAVHGLYSQTSIMELSEYSNGESKSQIPAHIMLTSTRTKPNWTERNTWQAMYSRTQWNGSHPMLPHKTCEAKFSQIFHSGYAYIDQTHTVMCLLANLLSMMYSNFHCHLISLHTYRFTPPILIKWFYHNFAVAEIIFEWFSELSHMFSCIYYL